MHVPNKKKETLTVPLTILTYNKLSNVCSEQYYFIILPQLHEISPGKKTFRNSFFSRLLLWKPLYRIGKIELYFTICFFQEIFANYRTLWKLCHICISKYQFTGNPLIKIFVLMRVKTNTMFLAVERADLFSFPPLHK